MAVKKKTQKTPREVRSEKDLIALRRDNITVGDSWMLLQDKESGIEVVIKNQKLGEAPTGGVALSMRVFTAMVDWFNTGVVPGQRTRNPRRVTR